MISFSVDLDCVTSLEHLRIYIVNLFHIYIYEIYMYVCMYAHAKSKKKTNNLGN